MCQPQKKRPQQTNEEPKTMPNDDDDDGEEEERAASSSWRQACRWLRFFFVTIPLLLFDGLRLFLYVLLLSPAFVQFAWYYFRADRKSYRYADNSCRQTADVYFARRGNRPSSRHSSSSAGEGGGAGQQGGENDDASSPLLRPSSPQTVVFFCVGGGWCIGYKMWGALTARALTAVAGLTVVVPDYRNYPVGHVPDMVNDVTTALEWTVTKLPDVLECSSVNVVVVGQSAGGHLAVTALLRKALERRMSDDSVHATDRPSDCNSQEETSGDDDRAAGSSLLLLSDTAFQAVRGVISLSAPYELTSMRDSFVRHGFDSHLIDRMFDHQQAKYSPHDLVAAQQESSLERIMPPVKLYHGDQDRTVPYQGSIDFCDELTRAGVTVRCEVYGGWNHTDAILEGPFAADHRFHVDVFDAVQEWTAADNSDSNNLVWPDDNDPAMRKLCPRFLVKTARCFMPF